MAAAAAFSRNTKRNGPRTVPERRHPCVLNGRPRAHRPVLSLLVPQPPCYACKIKRHDERTRIAPSEGRIFTRGGIVEDNRPHLAQYETTIYDAHELVMLLSYSSQVPFRIDDWTGQDCVARGSLPGLRTIAFIRKLTKKLCNRVETMQYKEHIAQTFKVMVYAVY